MVPHQGNKPELLTLAKQEMEQKAQHEQTEGDSHNTGKKTDHERALLYRTSRTQTLHIYLPCNNSAQVTRSKAEKLVQK